MSDLLSKQRRLAHLQKIAEQRGDLPHLYGQKMYPWQRTFWDSTSRINLITAGNQLGKSSIQIRKCIHWATDQDLWKKLWKRTPTMFWYLYPDYDTVTQEFYSKWVPEFLPRGKMKDDPVYGWTVLTANKIVKGIRFNSGVDVLFKTYGKDTATLQAGTLSAVFCDEELPVEKFDELWMRLSSAYTQGYFHMVFTATLAQDYWFRAMEKVGHPDEVLKEDTLKQQVSAYDCLFFEDGSKSSWTVEIIENNKRQLKSKNEVLKRIYGRFVKEESTLKYPTFNRDKHIIEPVPIPNNWIKVGIMDYGSGNHPAAISFLAISPDRKLGYVYKQWRGDGLRTTAPDVWAKFKEMRGSEPLTFQIYDQSCADLRTIAEGEGECVIPANKSHEIGEGLLNTLLSYGMLYIFEGEFSDKCATEFEKLDKTTAKQKAKDDLVDTIRYGVAQFTWDLEINKAKVQEKVSKIYDSDYLRKHGDPLMKTLDEIEEEFSDFNSLLEE